MPRKLIKVNIQAIVEYDDQEYDKSEVDESMVIAFRWEDKYGDNEVFLPKMNSIEVVEYIETDSFEIEQ